MDSEQRSANDDVTVAFPTVHWSPCVVRNVKWRGRAVVQIDAICLRGLFVGCEGFFGGIVLNANGCRLAASSSLMRTVLLNGHCALVLRTRSPRCNAPSRPCAVELVAQVRGQSTFISKVRHRTWRRRRERVWRRRRARVGSKSWASNGPSAQMSYLLVGKSGAEARRSCGRSFRDGQGLPNSPQLLLSSESPGHGVGTATNTMRPPAHLYRLSVQMGTTAISPIPLQNRPEGACFDI